ncbi:MAG: Ig-like domain-containing protein [Mangrovibacterium sp.]
MKKYLLLLSFGYMAYLLFTTSCANVGMPSGGDKDSIPPRVVHTDPAPNTLNYKGNSVSLTFDEFVISSELSSRLVVSPPLQSMPRVRSKSKTLTIELGDSLLRNVTYTLDFKDAIVDNNESNPLEDFRFAFSTGPVFDSLMIGGYVLNAENMEPVEDILVLLYPETDSLKAFREKIPRYVARTDAEGFYAVTNVSEGKYRLFALEDVDNSLTYSQPGERIAFLDSLVVPAYPGEETAATDDLDSLYFSQPLADNLPGPADSLLLSLADTLRADSLIQAHRPQRHKRMLPHYLLLFEEPSSDQFLESYKREQRNQINFLFTNSLTDSFRVELITPVKREREWAYMEFGAKRDSVTLWITDTLVSRLDTLKLEVHYQVLDSLARQVFREDTLEFYYSDPVRRGRRREREETPAVQPFSFRQNARSDFDPYLPLVLTVPEPLASFDYSGVHLYQQMDTLVQEIPVQPVQDSILQRRYLISHPWEYEGVYRLEIDSAAAVSCSGLPSAPLAGKFTIQKENYYGRILLNVSRVPGPSLVQLLKNTDNEELVKQLPLGSDGLVEFTFVKPEKFKIRLISDRNRNGSWDAGDLDAGEQPERVVYFPKILKIRSNFEIRENWSLPDDLQLKKKLIDEDADVQKNRNRSSGQRRRP